MASQTDSFGNTGSASLSFTLDTTAPVVAITQPGWSDQPGGADHHRHGRRGGCRQHGDPVRQWHRDGAGHRHGRQQRQLEHPVTLPGNGSHSIVTPRIPTPPATPAAAARWSITLSTTAPTLTEALTIDTGTSASDRITSNDALSGSGLANTVVHFTIDGSAIATTVTATAAGAWSFTPSGLADGAHTIVASQTDSFGNTGSASLSFTLDTTAPVVAITSTVVRPTRRRRPSAARSMWRMPAHRHAVRHGTATALGTATVGSNGSWSTPVTLPGNGSHSIVRQGTDAAGNTASRARWSIR